MTKKKRMIPDQTTMYVLIAVVGVLLIFAILQTFAITGMHQALIGQASAAPAAAAPQMIGGC